MTVNKEAKHAFQSTAGLFVLYIFSIANDISKENKRQKVIASDVYQALNEVGFEKYTLELKDFMKNYDANKEEKKQLMGVKRQTDQEAADEQNKRLRD